MVEPFENEDGEHQPGSFPRFLYLVHLGERSGTEVLFRPTIRDYMHDETVGFIAELIKRNASVLNIVDSDFAVLNQPLAAHYGVAGVQDLNFARYRSSRSIIWAVCSRRDRF